MHPQRILNFLHQPVQRFRLRSDCGNAQFDHFDIIEMAHFGGRNVKIRPQLFDD